MWFRFKDRLTVLILFSVSLMVAAGTLVVLHQLDHHHPTARLKDASFSIDLAQTEAERVRGLAGRANLSSREGMLFVFEEPGRHCFWMKDMLFSIDMLWFDDNSQLIYQQPNVSPDTYPQSFCPDSAAKYVLELQAGSVKKHDFNIGDKLSLTNL